MTVKISKRAIEKYLEDRGWKVTDLAEKSGVGYSTIYRAIRGEVFNSDTLEKMAKALGVNPIDLLEVKGEPAPLMGAPSVVLVA